jgi:hypothetical protein
MAGILMLLAAGLIPSELELRDREAHLDSLRSELADATRLHAAYGVFLDEAATGNTNLTRRLAAAQLGLIPADQQPVTIWKTLQQSPSRWIERAAATVHDSHPTAGPAITLEDQPSMLGRLVGGTGRLWLFAIGLFVIFAGLLLHPSRPEADTLEEALTT